ncbi:urease accessory UreF family protein [Roseobacter sp. N2S]|uniref:urease accessory protein UreF n=1 Tax=Roseobacter sp. N2S TaxID=2663844 RepID=UPI0028556A2F|nr:urease accessory UreF family protein [Roseobacter sp. N2S]MDR6266670.1 urease accessory protein [Roseobacter sp. N2S]
MTTDLSILTLSQWLSPAYPVGAFAYSHGLETAIQYGTIQTAADVQDWLRDLLAFGSGRNDCILFHAAYACETDHAAIAVDAVARANVPAAERLRETALQGAAFCKTTSAISGPPLPELTYPVAVGYGAKRLDIPAPLAAAMYLQAFTSTLISAAVRLVPLGQTEGQAVLSALSPLCHQIANDTDNTPLDNLQSSCFLSDIAAMTHETLDHRIFRS